MFSLGQRWISDTESELGLGLIQDYEGRFVEVYFPAAEATRRYAHDNAPLTRVIFQIGDKVRLQDVEICIQDIREEAELVFYSDGHDWYPETQLNAHLNLSRAIDRLFTGQIDRLKAFELRMAALQHQGQQAEGESFGLLGARTELLPHQLYIAKEVADREIPRVLLADEVGLGKTIEAGLIMHRLLLCERVQRILILVPTNLVHQWWIELARRFNLRFSIVDETVWSEAPADNVFNQSQLMIASVETVACHPELARQCLDADWDMLVVDEAHHLSWSSEQSELDPKYELVAALSATTAALLLLTATPEQLGVAGHFARLRLLDPERFHDFQQFNEESQQYHLVADAANALLDNSELKPEQVEHLKTWLDEEVVVSPTPAQRARWIQQLIDRHGTGRVIFRNTRNGIQGFPSRQLIQHPLESEDWVERLSEAQAEMASASSRILMPLLYPERVCVDWYDWDPRIPWLQQLLKENPGDKFLLICHQQQTVLTLHETMRRKYGIHCAQFHEQMSLIERDRAAAYFSDPQEGTQLMLCSEIGSEGRNFQFAQHLILFDLPLNCDLLEQRIGRLDRIGQQQEFYIHVPYVTHSANEALLRLYDEGLGLFRAPSVAAQALFEQYQENIERQLNQFGKETATSFEMLLSQIKEEKVALDIELARGRDRLLELHSCDKEKAVSLVEHIRRADRDATEQLPHYLEQLCDVYGMEQQESSHQCIALRPGDTMIADHIPNLPEEGLTYSCHREVALSRDDVQFFTWEHPFVRASFDLLMSSALGNTCVTFIKEHAFAPGSFYLDVPFVLVSQAPKGLQLQRYLPAAGLRLYCDPSGEIEAGIPILNTAVMDIPRTGAVNLMKKTKPLIESMLTKLEQEAARRMPQILQQAEEKMLTETRAEIQRLTMLKQKNPNIPQAEIECLEKKIKRLRTEIAQVQIQVDSVRVIFCA
ncbi:MAG TPA: RNA polymerase-associated protein RapA [Gammaproteobacteria bacterium]|nr:RNA polymerase-associated protein RapA [Gammaproteobacteria bacterium]